MIGVNIASTAYWWICPTFHLYQQLCIPSGSVTMADLSTKVHVSKSQNKTTLQAYSNPIYSYPYYLSHSILLRPHTPLTLPLTLDAYSHFFFFARTHFGRIYMFKSLLKQYMKIYIYCCGCPGTNTQNDNHPVLGESLWSSTVLNNSSPCFTSIQLEGCYNYAVFF